jgi:hypothetical protein
MWRVGLPDSGGLQCAKVVIEEQCNTSYHQLYRLRISRPYTTDGRVRGDLHIGQTGYGRHRPLGRHWRYLGREAPDSVEGRRYPAHPCSREGALSQARERAGVRRVSLAGLTHG